MDYLNGKVSQMVLENPNATPRQKTFVRSFSTKPKGGAERSGKIFGLIEIKSSHQKVPELIDLIIEEIKDNYYFEPKKTEEENLNDHFEFALKKTNLAIAAFIEAEQIDLDINKINIIIVLSHNQDLHFTVVGSTTAILFYNTDRNHYRIINILDTTKTVYSPPDPLKIFSQIISGRIRPKDILFIGTANILDYFSLERIKNIVTETTPDEGVKRLKKILEDSGAKENFGGISLELERNAAIVEKIVDISKFNYTQAASKDSIKELIRTEKETEKLLTPSLLPEIKKYASSFGKAFGNYLRKIKNSTSANIKKVNIPKPNLNLRPNIKFKKPNLPKLPGVDIAPAFKNASQLTKKSAVKIKPIVNSVKMLTAKLSANKIWNKLFVLLNKIFGNLILKFNKLPKSSKIFLIIIIILGFLFLQNIVWLGFKNNKEKRMEKIESIITEATNKKNESEASLIYRDESQARSLLIEAKNLLNNLETATKQQEEQVADLIKEIENQLQNLRHMVEIAEPTQIVNFQNLDGQADIANIGLLNNNTVYTQNLRNQSIYKANLNTRVMAAILSPDSNAGLLVKGTKINDNELIFFNESNSPVALNPANDTIRNLTINIPEGSNIVDITSFNNRLYLLDSAKNQIYRYSRSGNGFSNAENWIKDGVDLDGAKSLAIDGALYVLKENGEIIKLENGKQVEFKVKTIDPEFKSPTKIKTLEGSNYVYILDPGEKRLVVIDKNGNLIAQYASPLFNNLKDFFVDEKNKTIYILEGSSIFGIPIEHI